jgi:hypothetical protein
MMLHPRNLNYPNSAIIARNQAELRNCDKRDYKKNEICTLVQYLGLWRGEHVPEPECFITRSSNYSLLILMVGRQ